jgi:dinuclear metal center YbgI/SA1388 family protein
MRVRDVQRILDGWAPPDLAWERDNVGLQVGDPDATVRGILVALDVTEEVVKEAKKTGATLIVSHHPLLFRPLKSLTPASAGGRTVIMLAKHGIANIAAHTNLDFAAGGTNHALAARLGVGRVEFLRKPYRLQAKIVTFLPAARVQEVADAMGAAGAGTIGDYSGCSFRVEGTGTFFGGPSTAPAVGRKGAAEQVREVRLEMIVPRRSVRAAVKAMRSVHPYEEPAYDVYHLENPDDASGMGVVGTLDKPEPLPRFLARVRRRLGVRALRYTAGPAQAVRTVAMCGGSGGELLEDAVRAGADVFVTADCSYHLFHDAAGRIALVDAGHYETEHPVVDAVVARLKEAFAARGERVAVRAVSRSTNPVSMSV